MPPKKKPNLSKPYCGEKDPPPNNRKYGSSYYCFKKGMGVGYLLSEESHKGDVSKEKALKEAEKSLRRGLRFGFKEGKKRRGEGRVSRAELEALGKGELEAIAQRNDITGGRRKTKAQLIDEILAKFR